MPAPEATISPLALVRFTDIDQVERRGYLVSATVKHSLYMKSWLASVCIDGPSRFIDLRTGCQVWEKREIPAGALNRADYESVCVKLGIEL